MYSPKDVEKSVEIFDLMPFYMMRHKDITGTSGTGVVAQGMITTLDSNVYTVWQSNTPTFTVHDSLGKAKYIHGHDNATEFIVKSEEQVKPNDDDFDLLPSMFGLIHTDDPYGLSRIGLVGKGVLCNNGYAIFRWCVYPYQIEFFTSLDHFKTIHVSESYCHLANIDHLCKGNYL